MRGRRSPTCTSQAGPAAMVDVAEAASEHYLSNKHNGEVEMSRTRRRDDDPAEEILLDGQTKRVPLMLRDGSDGLTDVQRAVASGWKDAADKFFDRKVNVRDASGGTRGLHRPGYRVDRRVNDTEREAAYKDHEEFLTNQWRTTDAAPPGPYSIRYSAAAEHSPCTLNGGPGTLEKDPTGAWLVCRPTQSSDALTRTPAPPPTRPTTSKFPSSGAPGERTIPQH
jgi:hypothetical protein